MYMKLKPQTNVDRPLPSLGPAAAPAPSLALLLDVHNYVHASVFEELLCSYSDIFWVCHPRCDYVNDSENPLLSGGVMVMVIVVMVMRVVMGMVLAVAVVVTMVVLIVIRMGV
jgi:hypothetical protein